MSYYQVEEFYTHAGTHHADEAFAAAMYYRRIRAGKVDLILGEMPMTVPEDASLYRIVDIGHQYAPARSLFDHHQKNAPTHSRRPELKYSAFGLLWKHDGLDYVLDRLRNTCAQLDPEVEIQAAKTIFAKISTTLVYTVDAHDNGQEVSDLCLALNKFNRDLKDPKLHKENFLQMVKVCTEFLEAYADSFLETELKKINYPGLENLTTQELKGPSGRAFLLEGEFVHGVENEILNSPQYQDVLYLGFISSRGGYAVKAVPVAANSFASRKPYPKAWCGLEAEEADAQSPGMRFCHANGFFAVFHTREAAVVAIASLL